MDASKNTIEDEACVPREYELAFLSTDEGKVLGETLELLKREGANVTYESKLHTIRLAYPIKKQTSAFFGFLQFILSPDKALELRASLSHHPLILRFLLILLPRRSGKRVKQPLPVVEPRGVEPQATGGVLTNEALERKLEEILK